MKSTVNLAVQYETDFYDIVIVDSEREDEVREKYGVRNKNTGMVEVFSETFDNAVIACETLSYIVATEAWQDHITSNIEAIKSNNSKLSGAFAMEDMSPIKGTH